MRALIRKNGVKIEFSGRGQVWNEMLRPYLGGPEAPSEPEPARRTAEVDGETAAPLRLMSHRPEDARPAPAHVPAPARAPNVAPAPASAPAPRPVPVGAGAAAAAAPVAPRTWYPPRPTAAPAPAHVAP